jgi:hypothetical protein
MSLLSDKAKKYNKKEYYNKTRNNMSRVKTITSFILEKYEDNIRAKLIEMGVTNKNELEKQVKVFLKKVT